MKTSLTSNWRPLHNALGTLLVGIVALSARPRNALGEVGLYNATTGAAINANLIPGLIATSLVLSGNNLFAADFETDTIGEYNAATGTAINANLITGLDRPAGLALSGNNLLVSNVRDTGDDFIGAVSEFDSMTGVLIKDNLITGLDAGTIAASGRLALSGDNLFVSNSPGAIGEYNVTTGAAINANLVTGLIRPEGLTLAGSNLFVLSINMVGVYNAITGAAINSNLITGLPDPRDLALSGSNLFEANNPDFISGTVGKYDATTGAAIDASFITRRGLSLALAVSGNNLFLATNAMTVPEPSTWSMITMGGVALLGMMCRKPHRIGNKKTVPNIASSRWSDHIIAGVTSLIFTIPDAD
jgi:hypothetical protein